MRYFTILITLILNFSLIAQEEEFIATLSENTHKLSVENGIFGDSGGTILTEGVAGSQFVLIGEAHGLADVQEFAANLFALANKHGYNIMAVETDPFAAEKVAELARGDENDAAQFFSEYPVTIPFFNSEEGMRYARSVYAAAGEKTEFWGLDQVFAVGPRLIFSQLIEFAKNDSSRALAGEYLERANKAFGEAMQTGKMDGLILMQLNEEDFRELRDGFDKNDEAIEMIDQLALSQTIYKYWYAGKGYLNNSARSDLMKRLFRANYNRAIANGEDLPKVLFKLGAYHCVRGLTPTRIYDIGNMITELAAMNSTESLHVTLNAARGKSYNMMSGETEFDDTEDWHPWIKEALLDQLEEGMTDWLLVDLRPLRHIRLKEVDQEIKNLVYGYDLWVIIPEARPETPIK